MLLLTSCVDNSHKQFVIDNVDKMERSKYSNLNTFHTIDTLNGYHKHVTITIHQDSSYNIIFWGDRNSIWFDILRDKQILVNIPYNRYKGKNVDKDIEIIKAFQNKNKPDTISLLIKQDKFEIEYSGYINPLYGNSDISNYSGGYLIIRTNNCIIKFEDLKVPALGPVPKSILVNQLEERFNKIATKNSDTINDKIKQCLKTNI